MSKINCLIVDDEELARNLLENYIGRLPYLAVVDKCRDPFEALNVLNAQPVDLIFLDIQMPGLTGVEFLRTLEKQAAGHFHYRLPRFCVGRLQPRCDGLPAKALFLRAVRAGREQSERFVGASQSSGSLPHPIGTDGGSARCKGFHLGKIRAQSPSPPPRGHFLHRRYAGIRGIPHAERSHPLPELLKEPGGRTARRPVFAHP